MWQAVAMVIASVSSLQLGSAIATTGFNGGGPMGVVWIRSVVGGGLLAGHLRPNWRSFLRAQMQAIVPFALALVGLNVFYYLALTRLPLGVVSAIEMFGPLTVAAPGRRGGFDSALVSNTP